LLIYAISVKIKNLIFYLGFLLNAETIFENPIKEINMDKYLFTSESVTEGHPDKVADAISDSILDAIIGQDKNCRVACETLVTTGLAFISGEITTDCYVEMGFDCQTCSVITSIDRQSPDIAQGVNIGEGLHKEQGAGDQGLMFGFATDETPELMPMPILYAHKLCNRLATVRKNGALDFLRPDGKSQVTVEYENGTPKRVDTVVLSAQHKPDVSYEDLKEAIVEEVIKKVIPQEMTDGDTRYFINPTGRFVIGGPMGDCGVTGRKIIVDTYGGQGSHGGGCFSGKDPSKVDRSASYMGRHIAKNIVAAGLAKKCEIQIAYAIGVAQPVSVMVDLMGTGVLPKERVEKLVTEVFDLRPAAIIEYLDLLRPIYRKTSAYGHFGRSEPEFSWENTDMAKILKEKAGL
jgi:S-adenosylmethionine synthetase